MKGWREEAAAASAVCSGARCRVRVGSPNWERHQAGCPSASSQRRLLSQVDPRHSFQGWTSVSLETHGHGRWHQGPERGPTFPGWRLDYALGTGWLGASVALFNLCIDMRSEGPVSGKEEVQRGSVTSARSCGQEEKAAASHKWCTQGFPTSQEAEAGGWLEPGCSRPGWTTRADVSTKRERNTGERDIE